jgi:hypothetical protein
MSSTGLISAISIVVFFGLDFLQFALIIAIIAGIFKEDKKLIDEN